MVFAETGEDRSGSGWAYSLGTRLKQSLSVQGNDGEYVASLQSLFQQMERFK